MWVAVGVIGAAVVGGVASNVAANKAANAASDAAKLQSSASSDALRLESDQFEYQKQLNEPFYNMGLPAARDYASAITGKPQSYADPSYQRMSDDEIYALNRRDIQDRYAGQSIGNLDKFLADRPKENKYDPLKTYYRGPDGTISDKAPPTLTSEAWQPEETNAYKWQQNQMEKNTSRSLRAMGRYNSTYGMDAITKGNRDLASSEYDRQLGRLSDLTNVARGGASSLSALSGQYANNAGNNIVAAGNNQANSMLAGGLIKTNAMNNNVDGLYSLANMGMQYYGNKK